MDKWILKTITSDGTCWKRYHIKRGNDTVAILDEMLCDDAEELAREIIASHNGGDDDR